MQATCPSVSGHHFSHIKSHFNDLKQNFKIWGYLQKRLFWKVLPASKGALLNWCDRILTPLTNSEFCCQSNGANSIQVKRQNFCQIWRKIDNFYKKKIFSLFLIFWPKYLALVDNFQCQEDLILWNILCDNFGKEMSADFSCLFTFFKKK